jgi:hypothetical protein
MWLFDPCSRQADLQLQTETDEPTSKIQSEGRDEIGGVYLPSQLERILQLRTGW